MFKKDHEFPTGVVAALVVAAGAAVAVTFWIRRRAYGQPVNVIERSRRAVDELERRIQNVAPART